MADEVDRGATGISRRHLIKRGAVVGGTVMWAAPVVQTLTVPAGAQGLAGSPVHACCCCRDGVGTASSHDCSNNGLGEERTSASACRDFCAGGGADHQGQYNTFQYMRGGDPNDPTVDPGGCSNNTSGECFCEFESSNQTGST